jgi:hypothetical protein
MSVGAAGTSSGAKEFARTLVCIGKVEGRETVAIAKGEELRVMEKTDGWKLATRLEVNMHTQEFQTVGS